MVLFSICTFCNAQKIVFGSSSMTTADVNEEKMNRILRKSYHLPFVAGDSIADTTLLKLVASMRSRKDIYCIRFKDDSNRVAISVQKLNSGYEIISFWKNRFKKRDAFYNKSYLLNGEYAEYYENGWFKCGGQYINGKQAGKWEYYNEKGDKISEPK